MKKIIALFLLPLFFINHIQSAECGNKNTELLEFVYMDIEELNKEYCEARRQYINFLKLAGTQTGDSIYFYKAASDSCQSYAKTVKNVLKKEHSINTVSCPKEKEIILKKDEIKDEKIDLSTIDFAEGDYLMCSGKNAIDLDKFLKGKETWLTSKWFIKRDLNKTKISWVLYDDLVPPKGAMEKWGISYALVFMPRNSIDLKNQKAICLKKLTHTGDSEYSSPEYECTQWKITDSSYLVESEYKYSALSINRSSLSLNIGYDSFSCRMALGKNEPETLVKNFLKAKKPFFDIKRQFQEEKNRRDEIKKAKTKNKI